MRRQSKSHHHHPTEQQRERDQSTRGFWGRLIHEPINLFTAALAVGTLVLAVVNLGMLIEMQSAGEDTKKAIQATNRLADEAKRQADFAKENLIWSRRPWVDFAGGIEVNEPLTINSNGFVTLSIKAAGQNVGDSPALNTFLENDLHVAEWPSGDITEIIDKYICPPRPLNLTGAPFVQVIMPHTTLDLWPSKNVSNKLEPSISQKNIYAWTSICLRYEDGFGFPHTTGQIFTYLPDENAQIRTPFVGAIKGTLKPYTGKIVK